LVTRIGLIERHANFFNTVVLAGYLGRVHFNLSFKIVIFLVAVAKSTVKRSFRS
jgi:hypothetical protein